MELQATTVFVNNFKPFNDYVNLIQMHFENDADVEICALGTAIPRAIHISEVMQKLGLATKTRILICTVVSVHMVDKAKIKILLRKTNGGYWINFPVPLPSPGPVYYSYARPVPCYNIYAPLLPVPVHNRRNFRVRVPVYNVCNDKQFAYSLYEAKRHLNNHTQIQLCALEMAIPTAIRIAENLHRTGFADKIEVVTYRARSNDNPADRSLDRAKIQIGLRMRRTAE